jgi:branched-chain amino acid aminotransferase
MEAIVYLNGSFLPLSEAKVPVTDYGYLFGFGLYETLRAYKGYYFRLDAHLKRLYKSAQTLGIPVDVAKLKEIILETTRRNPFDNARMRVTLTPGTGSPVIDPASCTNPTVLCTVLEYKPFAPEVYSRGYNTIIFNGRRNSQSVISGMKATSIIESSLAKIRAHRAQADDALLLNEKGLLAEATSSNVFVVNHGVIKTPKTGSGLLPGITRQVIIELAGNLGLKFKEADIRLSELKTLDEVFLTNSMFEVLPVAKIDGRPVGSGKPGPITMKLADAYKQLVQTELLLYPLTQN